MKFTRCGRLLSCVAGSLGFGLGLVSCGGSSNPPAPPPPPPVNTAPVFNSPATQTSPENTSGAVYTATATDADNDALSFAIVSSADSNNFTIDAATGALSFSSPANFEFPVDANTDNIYEITLQVSDGAGGTDTLDLTITVSDVPEGFKTERVASGLTQSLLTTALPDGTGRLVTIRKGGEIDLLTPTSTLPYTVDSFMDISTSVSTDGERGLLGIAFSPNFASDGTFFLNVTNLAGDTEVRRYTTVSGRLDVGDPATADVILAIAQPFSNHNAGSLGFDLNGFLVIPMGDGGGGGDPNNVSQDPTSLLGKVLRIDVNTDDFPADDQRDYAIPPSNRFAGTPGAGREEIYAIGVRNPYRSSFDPLTGDLIMGDVGQNAVEEVNRLPMDDSSFNFGWAVREGTQPHNGGLDQPEFTAPVTEYFHGTGPTEGRSITGGVVYVGPIDALRNKYIFADFRSDNVWSVPAADLVNGSTVTADNFQRLNDELVPDAGVLSRIVGFGTDSNDDLYITNIHGDVLKVSAE